MIGASKAAVGFMQQPTIEQWIKTIQTERTKASYGYNLFRFLEGVHQTPDGFLAEIEKNPKQMSLTTKTFLGSVESKSTARVMLAAIRSFIAFYEAELPLNGLKIRAARVRKKPYLSWADAEKIINECKEPYRSAFRFMLWGGLGEDEFTEIQTSEEIQSSIESQRNNDKPYIRIDLRPRKSNIDSYFSLVPKQYVPRFPMLTLNYGNRGGEPIRASDLQMYWSRATERVGMRQVGLGPHSLRSAFSSACGKVGVADAVIEFQTGHGAGDRYGYRREAQDESYVVTELSKLWKGSRPVTASELDKRDQEIANLKEKLLKQYEAATDDIVDMTEDMDELRRENEELQDRLKKLEQTVAVGRAGSA